MRFRALGVSEGDALGDQPARTRGYGVVAMEARWAITPQTDLRVNYRHDGASVAGIGIGAYW